MNNRRLAGMVLALLMPACLVNPAHAIDGAAVTTATELRAAVASQRALPRAAPLPRAAFLESGALPEVQLSPTGDAVAALREQGDSRSLWLLPTGGEPARVLVGRTQASQLAWHAHAGGGAAARTRRGGWRRALADRAHGRGRQAQRAARGPALGA